MKFRNSDVPLVYSREAQETPDSTKWRWRTVQSYTRWSRRPAKLADRLAALRRANRGYRRRNGLTLRNA